MGFVREPKVEGVVGVVLGLIALGFTVSPVHSLSLAILFWALAALVAVVVGVNGWKRRSRPATQQGGTPMSRRIARQMAETVEFGLANPARPEVARAFKMIGTELRDIRSKIDRAKAAGFYTRGFSFPADAFTIPVRELLSDHPVYDKVTAAYEAAHNVNQTLRWREEQQGDGGDLLGVLASDGLDETHGLAGEALDALGEPHNTPFSTAQPRAASPVSRDIARRFHGAVEAGLTHGDREAIARFGDELAAFWTEREHARPAEIDQFGGAGSFAKNQRDKEREDHDAETVRLYHERYATQAIDQVREAREFGFLGEDAHRLAREPFRTNDIATLAARLRGLRPTR